MKINIYNTNYEAVAFVIVLILLIYLQIKYKNNDGRNKIFRQLVAWELLTVTLDIVTSVTISLASGIPDWLNLMANEAYFAVFGVLCYLFPVYCMCFAVRPRPRLRKAVSTVLKVFLGIFWAIMILNIPTGLVFAFRNSEYIHGPLYILCTVVPLLFVATALGIIIYLRKDIPAPAKAALTLLSVFSIAGPILQFYFFPDILLSNATSSTALVLCLLTLETPNYNLLVSKRNELQELKENLENEISRQTSIAVKKKEERQQLSAQIVDALALAIDEGSIEKDGHSMAVAEMSRKIALKMGMSEEDAQSVFYMAAVHDIGMIGINENVPAKDGPFDDEDREEMQRHTVIGDRLLADISEMPDMDVVARSHHERWDGKGYPDGLKGEEIPLEARIVCVADAYDGMTAKRNYKFPRDTQDAIEEFKRNAGTQFDPKVVDAIVAILSE